MAIFLGLNPPLPDHWWNRDALGKNGVHRRFIDGISFAATR